MAKEEAGLELPIGLTEQKFLQQLARIEAKAIKSSNGMAKQFVQSNAQIGKSFTGMSGQARAGLQNVSYQMQDFYQCLVFQHNLECFSKKTQENQKN